MAIKNELKFNRDLTRNSLNKFIDRSLRFMGVWMWWTCDVALEEILGSFFYYKNLESQDLKLTGDLKIKITEIVSLKYFWLAKL